MNNIYNRVAAWNSKRYDRVLDRGLLLAMLREEYQEFLDAPSQVAKLDALCDISYVAMGGLWKMNLKAADLEESRAAAMETVLAIIDANEPNPIYTMALLLDAATYEADYPTVYTCHMAVCVTVCQAMVMGLSQEQFEEALLVVCDSNDTKVVDIVAPNVKANKDKGANFVAPEPRLQIILDKANG